jgi:hypothetical protein
METGGTDVYERFGARLFVIQTDTVHNVPPSSGLSLRGQTTATRAWRDEVVGRYWPAKLSGLQAIPQPDESLLCRDDFV